MNAKVKLTNLAPWPLYFERKNNLGNVTIPENGVFFLERDEVMSQMYGNNVMFVGTDQHGAHARILVDDADIRKQFDFPDEQLVATDEALDKAFSYKQQSTFEKYIRERIVEQFEKNRLIEYIKKKNINDYQKIRFSEIHTGISLDMK